MGMKQSGYVLGWLATTYAKGLFVSFIYLTISLSSGGYKGAVCSPVLIIFSYLFYFSATLAQTFALTTFFNQPRLATDLSNLVSFIQKKLINLQYLSCKLYHRSFSIWQTWSSSLTVLGCWYLCLCSLNLLSKLDFFLRVGMLLSRQTRVKSTIRIFH